MADDLGLYVRIAVRWQVMRGEEGRVRRSRLTTQYGADFAGMTRDGDVGAAVRGEDAVKDPFGPDGLVCAGLAVESYPELVVWSEAGLDPVAWE